MGVTTARATALSLTLTLMGGQSLAVQTAPPLRQPSPVSARVTEQPAADSWKVFKLSGSRTDAQPLAAHFGSVEEQENLHQRLRRAGYEADYRHGTVSRSDQVSVLAVPINRFQEARSTIEVLLETRGSLRSAVVFRFKYELAPNRLTKIAVIDLDSGFGFEKDVSTGTFQELQEVGAAAVSVSEFVRCFLRNILSIRLSQSCSGLSGIALDVVVGTIVAAVIDNPVTLAAVAAAIVGAFGTSIICSGVQCSQGGGGGVDRDEQAKRDMRSFAQRDGRFGNAQESTFGRDPNWSSAFELRWMHFPMRGRGYTITLYHATNKNNPSDRSVGFFDPDRNGAWNGWHRVE